MTAIARADRARRQRGQGVLMSAVAALPGAGAAAMLAN